MSMNHSVLVVEDSRFQAKLLRKLLEEHGYIVQVAGDGQAGLDALAQNRPSLILSDIVMPVMDGFEMCRAIKNQEHLKTIPVVLLTTQSRPEDVLLGLSSGADSYVTKPYEETVLLSTIEAILAVSTLQAPEGSDNECQVSLKGRFFSINAGRRQMVNFLISAYQDAFLQNQRLTDARNQLVLLNEGLEKVVTERTKELSEEVEKRKIAQERLRQLAIRDGLTKVFNYRYFMEVGVREFERVKRYGRPLSLILIDIDHFKSVNDTHGHNVGDRALQVVAQICLRTIRNVDVLARVGGEEFAVLLPETGLDQACLVAERMRSTVARTVFTTSSAELRLTLSLGVSALTDEAKDFGHLLRMVDAALYTAKRNGRNRVEYRPYPRPA
jgi:diguanylate cyclase (GGDEF)-like protein